MAVMKITVEMLREKGACALSVRWFKFRFPDGLQVTRANARVAACASPISLAEPVRKGEVDWAATELLSVAQYHWYWTNTGGWKTVLQLAEAFWRASKMED